MLRLLSFYVLLGLVLWLIKQSPWSEILHAKIAFLWAFFFFLSYLAHLMHQLGWANGREKLVPMHMAVQGLRFIGSLIFIGFFAYQGSPKLLLFVGNFFALYLLSTYFEITTLLRNLRRF